MYYGALNDQMRFTVCCRGFPTLLAAERQPLVARIRASLKWTTTLAGNLTTPKDARAAVITIEPRTILTFRAGTSRSVVINSHSQH